MCAAVRFVASFPFTCQRICHIERDNRFTLKVNLSRDDKLTRVRMKQKELYKKFFYRIRKWKG